MSPLRRFACASLFVTVQAVSAAVLSVDINDALDNPTDTAPGFVDYVLADNTLTVGAYSVEINPQNGAALDDVVFVGETVFGDGSAFLKWRASMPMPGTSRQYFRLRATPAP